jgi:hypothetical protein
VAKVETGVLFVGIPATTIELQKLEQSRISLQIFATRTFIEANVASQVLVGPVKSWNSVDFCSEFGYMYRR